MRVLRSSLALSMLLPMLLLASLGGPVCFAGEGVTRSPREIDAELREYRVAAVTGGEDALGQVTVVLRQDGATASGQGVSTDILEASAQAYVRALSNVLAEVEAADGDGDPTGTAGAKGP